MLVIVIISNLKSKIKYVKNKMLFIDRHVMVGSGGAEVYPLFKKMKLIETRPISNDPSLRYHLVEIC